MKRAALRQGAAGQHKRMANNKPEKSLCRQPDEVFEDEDCSTPHIWQLLTQLGFYEGDLMEEFIHMAELQAREVAREVLDVPLIEHELEHELEHVPEEAQPVAQEAQPVPQQAECVVHELQRKHVVRQGVVTEVCGMQDTVYLVMIDPMTTLIIFIYNAAAFGFTSADVQHTWHSSTGKSVLRHLHNTRKHLHFVLYSIAGHYEPLFSAELVPLVHATHNSMSFWQQRCYHALKEMLWHTYGNDTCFGRHDVIMHDLMTCDVISQEDYNNWVLHMHQFNEAIRQYACYASKTASQLSLQPRVLHVQPRVAL